MWWLYWSHFSRHFFWILYNNLSSVNTIAQWGSETKSRQMFHTSRHFYDVTFSQICSMNIAGLPHCDWFIEEKCGYQTGSVRSCTLYTMWPDISSMSFNVRSCLFGQRVYRQLHVVSENWCTVFVKSNAQLINPKATPSQIYCRVPTRHAFAPGGDETRTSDPLVRQ